MKFMMNRVLMVMAVVAVALTGAVGLDGCAGTREMIKVSSSTGKPVDRAEGLKAIFDSYQEAIEELVTNSVVPIKEKRFLVRANDVATPAALALNDAAKVYNQVDDQIAAIRKDGGTPDQKILDSLDLVLSALERALTKHEPTILKFQGDMAKHGVLPKLTPEN